MPPSREKSIIFHFSLNPLKSLQWSSFKKFGKVNRIDIAKTSVLCIATSNHKELISYLYRRMKASWWRFYSILFDYHFLPSHRDEIEDPEIIEVCDSFPSEDNKVGIEELSSVISPFPRSRLIGFRVYLHPLLGLPIKYIYGIEPLLIRSSASEDNDSIIISIIAHGAIGAMRGDIASRVYLFPLHSDCVECP